MNKGAREANDSARHYSERQHRARIEELLEKILAALEKKT